MQEQIAAGKNIEAYCTKCRLNLDHTIMAMIGETIAKVRCKTCGGAHKFKNPAEAPKARKPRVKKGVTAEATAAILWEAGLSEAKGKERDYSMAMKYRVGDVVNHSTFGKGIVMKLYTNKCDMLFKDKERLMASANEYKRV
jgi:NMD protein affecting ribosome stability and mRNA decay